MSRTIRITNNEDLGNLKPKFKIGNKVRVNEFGKKELGYWASQHRDGVVTEIVIVPEVMVEYLTSKTYYLTATCNGKDGTWEEYLEKDESEDGTFDDGVLDTTLFG